MNIIILSRRVSSQKLADLLLNVSPQKLIRPLKQFSSHQATISPCTMVMESESSNQRERDSTTTVVLTFVASLVLQNSKIVLIMDNGSWQNWRNDPSHCKCSIMRSCSFTMGPTDPVQKWVSGRRRWRI